MERTYIRDAYRKALKTVDTCANLDHVEGARKYINLFFKVYSDSSRSSYGPFEVREADDLLVRMYNRLYEKLDEKQIELELVV